MTQLQIQGKWGPSAKDDMCMSYLHIPSSDTMVKIAGAASEIQYLPFWTMIVPPAQLTSVTLSGYHKSVEIIEKARDCTDVDNLLLAYRHCPAN